MDSQNSNLLLESTFGRKDMTTFMMSKKTMVLSLLEWLKTIMKNEKMWIK